MQSKYLNYKNILLLRQTITVSGKIIPKRKKAVTKLKAMSKHSKAHPKSVTKLQEVQKQKMRRENFIQINTKTKKQRHLAKAIKNARLVAFLPFVRRSQALF